MDVLGQLRSALSTRYSIDREIGRGGMPTVYLARAELRCGAGAGARCEAPVTPLSGMVDAQRSRRFAGVAQLERRWVPRAECQRRSAPPSAQAEASEHRKGAER